MGKLYTFGCSYTEEFNDGLYISYKKWRGGTYPKTWVNVLSDKLGIPFVNYGKGGSSNSKIFAEFCRHSNEIQEGDIVIIEWSYLSRFRWVNHKNNCWNDFGPGNFIYDGRIEEITFNEIIYNKSHQKYAEELYDYQILIDSYANAKNFKVYYWSCDELIINNTRERVENKKYLCGSLIKHKQTIFDLVFSKGGLRIFEETKKRIDDNHFGESAHNIMGELFYEHISKN